MGSEPEIVLDDRRRTSFSKIGHRDHRRYLVKELEDGTLVLTPAFTISAPELAVLRDAALTAGLRASKDLRHEDLRSRGSFAPYGDESVIGTGGPGIGAASDRADVPLAADDGADRREHTI